MCPIIVHEANRFWLFIYVSWSCIRHEAFSPTLYICMCVQDVTHEWVHVCACVCMCVHVGARVTMWVYQAFCCEQSMTTDLNEWNK